MITRQKSSKKSYFFSNVGLCFRVEKTLAVKHEPLLNRELDGKALITWLLDVLGSREMPNVQKDATCNIQQCWELFANNVASFCCSRSNDDDDDFNENSKKAIALDEQNNNFARASRF